MMFAAQHAIKTSLVTGLFVRRGLNYQCTPPRVRISLPEKLAHGAAIFVGVLLIPGYIALNIKNYRQESD